MKRIVNILLSFYRSTAAVFRNGNDGCIDRPSAAYNGICTKTSCICMEILMKKSTVLLWQAVGTGVVSLLGTLLHFLYDGAPSFVTALFGSVNESTWEHMKLLLFSLLLFACVEYIFFKDTFSDFWCVKLRGTLIGLWLIPVLYYTLQGVFGKVADFVAIGIFFVAVLGTFSYETWQFCKRGTLCKTQGFAIGLLCLLVVLFWVWTFFPPHIPLFADPIDGHFGR